MMKAMALGGAGAVATEVLVEDPTNELLFAVPVAAAGVLAFAASRGRLPTPGAHALNVMAGFAAVELGVVSAQLLGGGAVAGLAGGATATPTAVPTTAAVDAGTGAGDEGAGDGDAADGPPAAPGPTTTATSAPTGTPDPPADPPATDPPAGGGGSTPMFEPADVAARIGPDFEPDTTDGLTPNSLAVLAVVEKRGMKLLEGVVDRNIAGTDTRSHHATGRAVDVSDVGYGATSSAAMRQLMADIVAAKRAPDAATSELGRLPIEYVILDSKIYSSKEDWAARDWSPRIDPADWARMDPAEQKNQLHDDHLHISVKE